MIGSNDEKIYTVSQLNGHVRALLEESFGCIWVEGEISNFTAPQSGHWYFSLKDERAQVRCAMFRGQQRKLDFIPKNGAHVLLKARIGLYENKGDYQLIAEDIEDRGEGKLRRLFEALKKRLQALGIFSIEHKKNLPLFIRTLGVITSPTGAAIRDILTVLNRRYPALTIIIYPALVQGETAAAQIVEAIHTANQRNECDVLLLARGGGSLEDLWPFNEENVAMAIYDSLIPTITGMGHEIDYTIADFVADKRAPTPSAAAELLTPDQNELQLTSRRYQTQINQRIKYQLNLLKEQLGWMQKHLEQKHPRTRLLEKMQQLDYCFLSLERYRQYYFSNLHKILQHQETKLRQFIPLTLIQQRQDQLTYYYQQFFHLMRAKLTSLENSLAKLIGLLGTLSPLATLKRGYAIVHSVNPPPSNDYSILNLNIGDKIEVLLEKGRLECTVDSIQFSS